MPLPACRLPLHHFAPEIAASVELRNRRAREQASVSVHLVLVDYDCEGDTRPAHPARPNVSSSSSLACRNAAIQSKGLRALLRARSHHIPVRVPISGSACTHSRRLLSSVLLQMIIIVSQGSESAEAEQV